MSDQTGCEEEDYIRSASSRKRKDEQDAVDRTNAEFVCSMASTWLCFRVCHSAGVSASQVRSSEQVSE